MLVIVAILLFFGVVVRHKWKNAAAKKEEILRLLASASKEEAEIAKLQAVDVYNSPSEPQPQIENRYCCAVCYSPTKTRCSQCKAIRYCSGKCQIIHWRRGHKDECQPASSVLVSKESASVLKTALVNQFEINFKDEAEISSDPTEDLNDAGSSNSSLHCFSSSTERSDTSFDASSSEALEPGTPIEGSEGAYSHMSRTTSDSDEADVLSTLNSTVQDVKKKIEANKTKKSQTSQPGNGFQTSFEVKRSGPTASLSENFILGTTEFRNPQSSVSTKPPSSMEIKKNQAHPFSGRLTKSKNSRRTGHNQVPTVDIRSLPCSKSLNQTSLEGFWGNISQSCNATETRSLSYRSPDDDQRMSTTTGCSPSLLSEIEGPQTSSRTSNNTLKSSVQKFVQHFRVSKQSKSSVFGMENNSAANYSEKIIFPLKLFMQLYNCDGVELHPVGLVNCGNSCYANAVLQCLIFTRPKTAYLLQGLHSATCRKRGWCLICEFEHLIRRGQEMNSPLSPIGILSQIQRIGNHLSHGREEDAHDFLRNVVDTMQSIWLEEAHASGHSS